MPLCFVVLSSLLSVLHTSGLSSTTGDAFLPHRHEIIAWWPHLIGNACIAFTLNVVIALVVKYSSAVGFILAGITKDAMIVIAGALFLSEHIASIQACGFAIQLIMIGLYSLVKTFPDKFENGIGHGFALLFSDVCGTSSTKLKPELSRDYGAVVNGARKENH